MTAAKPTVSVRRARLFRARGHPVGATGVRQVVEVFQQVNGEARVRQVEGARTALTFNIGGSLTTSVAMVWGGPA